MPTYILGVGLKELVLFYDVGPGDQTQGIKLGSKSLIHRAIQLALGFSLLLLLLDMFDVYGCVRVAHVWRSEHNAGQLSPCGFRGLNSGCQVCHAP